MVTIFWSHLSVEFVKDADMQVAKYPTSGEEDWGIFKKPDWILPTEFQKISFTPADAAVR